MDKNDHDKLKIFKPEHGKEMLWDCRNDKVIEKLAKISELQNAATMYLYAITLTHKDHKYHIPCVQCLKDTAMQYEEIGSLLRELCDDKS